MEKAIEKDMLFGTQFDRICREYGDKIAACDRNGAVTYHEMDHMSNYLASVLLELFSEGKSRNVAVAIERSVLTAVLMIAIWKAGGTYLPVDRTYPPERIRAILNRSEAAVCIASASLPGSEEVCVKFTGDILEDYDRKKPYRPVDFSCEQMISYIIFTSGTTGTPKGAAIRMQGMMNHLYNKIELLGIHQHTRIVQNASQCFDISIWQFLSALLTGGEVHIISNEEVRDLPFFTSYIKKYEIDIMECVPSYFDQLLAEDQESLDNLNQLSYILLTGERVPVSLCRRWYGLDKKAVLINAYGPTECSDDITHYFVPGDIQESVTNLPIGYAIRNGSLTVARNISAEGDIEKADLEEKGELIVSGLCVGDGYVNDEASTNKHFFTDRYHTRYYRTGDLVSEQAGGLFLFWGRLDRQIKVNGYRIESQEIEEVLRRYPGMGSCYVLSKKLTYNHVYLLESEKNNRRGVEKESLIAYYIPERKVGHNQSEAYDLQEKELRKWLTLKLPAYMVPHYFIRVDHFPFSENGKLKEADMPVPGRVTLNHNAYEEPINETEAEMAAIWEEILGITPIGRGDNFMELGGDSLSAIRVLSRIFDGMGRRIKYGDFVLSENLAAVCKKLYGQRDEKERLIKTDRFNESALSFTEQGQYFLWKLEPHSPYYTFQGLLHIFGSNDYHRMRRLVNSLVEKNAVLRSNYISADHTVRRHIRDFKAEDYLYMDLSGQSSEANAMIHKVSREEGAHVFDLEKDPLFRCTICKMADREYSLLLTMHEIIMDAWSIYKLIEEFVRLWGMSEEEIRVYSRELQYHDFAEWENRIYKRNLLSIERSYWEKQLAGELPVLELAFAKRRPDQPTYRAESISMVAEGDSYKEITDFNRTYGFTLFTSLMSAYLLTLSFYSGQDDVLVGCPNAGRDTKAKEEMYGCFINMLPIREHIQDHAKVIHFFQHTHQTVCQAIEHADYPFMRMVEEKKIERSHTISPVFQVMFDMVNFPVIDFSPAGELTMSFEEVDLGYRKYDLNLYAYEQENRLFLRLAYQTDLFGRAEATTLMETFRHILAYTVHNQNNHIYELKESIGKQCRMDDRERGIAPVACDEKLMALMTNRNIPGEAVLYQDRSQKVSYALLKEKIAYKSVFFRSHKIGEKSVVVLYADKDVETVINMLSLLLLGAVYVPFDVLTPLGVLKTFCDTMKVNALISDIPLDGLPAEEWDHKWFYPMHREIRDDREGMACIVMTSASGGGAKYVGVTRTALVNRIYAQDIADFGLPSVKTMISLRSLSLVTHIFELFSNLLYGNRLLLLKRAEVLEVKEMVGTIYRERVDYMVLAPSLLRAILEEAASTGKSFDFIHTVCSGSERLEKHLIRQCAEVFDQCTLYNTYGTTETSSTIYIQKLDKNGDIIDGYPIRGMSVSIENDHGSKMLVGVTGHIIVRGTGVANGYLNQSTGSFFFDRNHDWCYHTGDTGCMNVNGRLEIKGRTDRIVKCRGFRINLAEMENYCRLLEGVSEAACINVHQDAADGYAVLFVSRNSRINENILFDHLKEHYPLYMLPQFMVKVEELPHTISGKIRYGALKELIKKHFLKVHDEEMTRTEKEVKKIFSHILSGSGFSIDDNFFIIGGHSLLAIRLAGMIEEHFGIPFMVAEIYSGNSSVRELAGRIDRHVASADEPEHKGAFHLMLEEIYSESRNE